MHSRSGFRQYFNTSDWAYRIIRWFLGGLFIYAGSVKLLDPESFAVLIDAYGLVPDGLLMPIAVGLPALEVLAGAGLLFDIEWSLSVIAGLLVIFVAILSYGIRMGLDIDCGCFGPEDPESRAFHGLKTTLYRDLAMLAGVVFLGLWRWKHGHEPKKISVLTKNIFLRREDANV